MNFKKMKTESNVWESLICFADPEGGDDSGAGGGDDSGSDTAGEVQQVTEILKKPGTEPLAHDEIKKMLNFDPVKIKEQQKKDTKPTPPVGDKSKKSQPVSQKTSPGKTPVKPGEKTQTPATPTPPAQPALDPNVAALAQTVSKLVGTQAKAPDGEKKAWYGGHTEELDIDPRVMQLLDSDDPNHRMMAMKGIINGTANQVFEDTMQYVHKAVIPNIMQQAQQMATETFQRLSFEKLMRDKHPVFRDQNLRNVVNTFGNQLIQSKQAANQPFDFNDEFLDELLPMVLTYIQTTTGIDPSQQTQTVIPSPTPTRKPPHVQQQTARPPADSVDFSQSADLLDSVGLGHLRRPN